MFFSGKKIFCVGHNKTGTTSLAAAMKDMGYKVGRQSVAERLFDAWCHRDFGRIAKYCRSAEFFQDVPFSLPYLYVALDQAFPGSKFILTVRDSADVWYESTCKFHERIVGKGRLPTWADLEEYDYREKGWLLDVMRRAYGVSDEQQLYDGDHYRAYYERHNAAVVDYFRFRPDDLLVINLAEKDSMERLCRFLGRPFAGQEMPHMNKRK